MKKLSLLILSSLMVACGGSDSNKPSNFTDDPGQNIIGGSEVRSGDSRFKSVVGIIMVDDRTGQALGVCTGTLIRKNVVLTAAHCVLASKGKVNFILYFGTDLLNLNQTNAYRVGVAAITHEKYSAELDKDAYDIALIKFDGDLPPGFAPVEILKDPRILQNGTPLLVAGFGRNDRYGNDPNNGTGTLRQVELSVSDAKYSDTEFRSTSIGKGICQGDSGGPAYVSINNQLYVAGVSNRVFGIGRINCILASVFLKVDQFHFWIEQNINRL